MNPTLSLPQHITKCFQLIEAANAHVFVIGGACRDAYFGWVPNDFDLATDATPDRIKSIFHSYTLLTMGEKYGTITVIIDGQPVEITTYRKDHLSSDSRHPNEVSFTTSLDEDLLRRDFTWNAIAFHPQTGFYDPFNGVNDLRQRKLVFVGDPVVRLREDSLRALRAIRFMSSLGLMTEPSVFQTIAESVPKAFLLPIERIMPEIEKIITGKYFDMIYPLFAQVLLPIIPEQSQQQTMISSNLYPLRLAFLWRTLDALQVNSLLAKWKLSKKDSQMVTLFHQLMQHSAPHSSSALHQLLLNVPTSIRHDALMIWFTNDSLIQAQKWLTQLEELRLPFTPHEIKLPSQFYQQYHILPHQRQQVLLALLNETVQKGRWLTEHEMQRLVASFAQIPIK